MLDFSAILQYNLWIHQNLAIVQNFMQPRSTIYTFKFVLFLSVQRDFEPNLDKRAYIFKILNILESVHCEENNGILACNHELLDFWHNILVCYTLNALQGLFFSLVLLEHKFWVSYVV